VIRAADPAVVGRLTRGQPRREPLGQGVEGVVVQLAQQGVGERCFS